MVMGELATVLLSHTLFLSMCTLFLSQFGVPSCFSNCAQLHQGLGTYQEHLAPEMSFQM